MLKFQYSDKFKFSKFLVTRVCKEEEAHKYVYITTLGHEFLLNVSHKQVVEP